MQKLSRHTKILTQDVRIDYWRGERVHGVDMLGRWFSPTNIEHKLDTYDIPPARWMLVQISFVDVYKQKHLPEFLLEE